MQITKIYRTDHELIIHFLNVLDGGSTILMSSKRANPGFFILAQTFIKEFIEEDFFQKEELLIRALEDNGFPSDDGPTSALRAEQHKSQEAVEHLLNAAKGWQAGDLEARGEVVWATSDYTSTLRQHIDRLKNRIFPLLEQNISPEDEHKIAEGLNAIAFENNTKGDTDKFTKLIQSLEEELKDWK
jgi:hemerythrin-like domain-containing protein